MLEIRNVTKLFPGVVALDSVSLDVVQGEVHVVAGENGAGKSTLMKVIAGLYEPDSGEVTIDGELVDLHSPVAARRHGVVMIPQELSLIPEMTIADNIACGQEPRTSLGFVDRRALEATARDSLDLVGAKVDVRTVVRELPIAQQQLVEIARALSSGPRLIIMDEPTDSLSLPDAERLLAVIRDLRSRGTAVVYISHRLPEITAIADRVTVLRDGRKVSTLEGSEITRPNLISAMIGREMAYGTRKQASDLAPGAKRVLSVVDATSPGKFERVSLDLHEGEVVGLAGLVGAGRTELARALFGLDENVTGTFEVDGSPYRPSNPIHAIRAGLAYVPEDRKQHGAIATLSIKNNIGVTLVKQFSKWGLVDTQKERRITTDLADRVRVKRGAMGDSISTLSGGNQQKAILARWLGAGAQVLILDEPTRGVDVGAKAEIHSIVMKLAEQGTGVLLISSEVDELVENADRVIVMKDGSVAGELSGAAVTESRIRALALVGVDDETLEEV